MTQSELTVEINKIKAQGFDQIRRRGVKMSEVKDLVRSTQDKVDELIRSQAELAKNPQTSTAL